MTVGLKTCAVQTMVYKDYVFLERFVAYYAKHVGLENVYIFSHGNDPRHHEIAKGANVVAIPRDPQLEGFDRRRWTMLSFFASGLSQLYKWVITSDVDEFVLLDPEAGDTLASYLEKTYPDLEKAPASISPFALELIHNPEIEPEPIEDGVPILSRRRVYRPSRGYSKPCVTRTPVRFTPGGHANNLGPRVLSDDLYLLHLRFFDFEYLTERLQLRTDQVKSFDWITEERKQDHCWVRSFGEYQQAAKLEVLGEDVRLEPVRARMLKQRNRPGTQLYGWGQFPVTNLYRIPERFSTLV